MAASGYAALAVVLTWPLARHLSTRFLAHPSTDLGIYVWNLWIFRYEFLENGRLPFFTDRIFAYTGGADLALHNYAPIAGAMAVPLVGPLGIVATYNTLLILFLALSGLGVFVLAERLGLGRIAAWSAGAVFVASPVMSAKATQHFSLIVAAALPLFLWSLLRALEARRTRDAVLVGAIVGAAAWSDAYYPIYCLLMGLVVLAARLIELQPAPRPAAARPARVARALDAIAALLALLLLWRGISGTTVLQAGPVRVGLQTLYTPVFVLSVTLAARAWLTWRPRVRIRALPEWPRLVRLAAVSAGVTLLLVTPHLAGIARTVAHGDFPRAGVHWRSSPRGVDALAYVVPNPTHAAFGETTRQWFMPPGRTDAFPELVAAFPLSALALVALGVAAGGVPRFWMAFTGVFVSLSFGPFIHLAGLNTYVPGPWALLRYVPLVGMARSPSRFAIVAALGLSLLVAFALEGVRRNRRLRPVMAVLAALVIVEALPAPRTLFSADVPAVYQRLAAETDKTVRLLELPAGIRDGTSSFGDFTAASEYYQTRHELPLIGGYLSRVAERRKEEKLLDPVLRALFELSEGGDPPPELVREARAGRKTFLQRSCVRFVVVDRHRASPALQAFAADVLQLETRYEDASHVLLAPVDPPGCVL